jgi:uncharacterized repeat protein (TIGR01451 family)
MAGALTSGGGLTASTPDPDTSNTVASATTIVLSPASVTATKTVEGIPFVGGLVTYRIVLRNEGPSTQFDDLGPQFTDVFPLQVVPVSATATSGAVPLAGASLAWNGIIPASSEVTIRVQGLIDPSTQPGTLVSNQGATHFDADGNGTNESVSLTNDPTQGPGANPTTFVAGGVLQVPVLSSWGLGLFGILIALAGVLVFRPGGGPFLGT